jgi:hypothetical protein
MWADDGLDEAADCARSGQIPHFGEVEQVAPTIGAAAAAEWGRARADCLAQALDLSLRQDVWDDRKTVAFEGVCGARYRVRHLSPFGRIVRKCSKIAWFVVAPLGDSAY